MKKLLIFSLLFAVLSNANSGINKILENDRLLEHVKENLREEKKNVLLKQKKLESYNSSKISEEDFYKIMTRYWLVKNKKKMKWDVVSTNYISNSLLKRLDNLKVLFIKSKKVNYKVFPFGRDKLILINKDFFVNLELTRRQKELFFHEILSESEEFYLKVRDYERFSEANVLREYDNYFYQKISREMKRKSFSKFLVNNIKNKNDKLELKSLLYKKLSLNNQFYRAKQESFGPEVLLSWLDEITPKNRK